MTRVSFSEMKILEVLWNENKAMSITEINEILNKNGIQWAYRTVATFLRRMQKKEAVASMKKGKSVYYYPLFSNDEMNNAEAKKLIDSCYKGSLTAFLTAFVKDDSLTENEMNELRDWFDKFDD